MEKSELLKVLAGTFDDLRMAGKVLNKKDLAARIGVSYNGLTLAFRGDPQNLTDSLVSKVVKLKKEMLGDVPAAPAAPDVVIPGATAQMYADMAAVIRSQQETIALLASQLAGVAVSGGVFSEKEQNQIKSR